MLHQMIYASRAAGDPREDLPEILRCSRRNNAELGLTGMLVVVGRLYVQLLEGEPEYMEPLIDLLKSDRRHGDLRILGRRETWRRAFPEWTMASIDLDPADEKALLDLLARIDTDCDADAQRELIEMMTGLSERSPVA